MIYGVQTMSPIRVKSTEEMLEVADLKLLAEPWLHIGDSVIIVAGAPFGEAGSANLIKLHRVGHVGFRARSNNSGHGARCLSSRLSIMVEEEQRCSQTARSLVPR